MLHPRLTSLDGTRSAWLAQIGPYGAWSDLSVTTRWGQGACGMYEASWTMPLPRGYDHPLLRRGTQVELMDGPWRVGSSLVLANPGKGAGIEDPWKLTATGIGREVEGNNSFFSFDSSHNATAVDSVAVDQAIADGWRIAGRDASTVGGNTWGAASSDGVIPLGALLSGIADEHSIRWGVGQDNVVRYMAEPTVPTYHVVPGAAALGTGDDDYASTVRLRFIDSTSHLATTASATNADVEARYGHREFLVDLTGPDYGEMSATTAQNFADGILAKSKGRLAWTNGLTLTSNEILTSGGVPASLSKVLEDVGTGCMVRLHGIFDDLLELTGNTWLDIVIGEAKWTDGAASIDLSPLGLAPRDLASVQESVTAMAAA